MRCAVWTAHNPGGPDPHVHHHTDADRRGPGRRHPLLPRQLPGGGPRRPPPAHRSHAPAREGDRLRRHPGRASSDDRGARPLLGQRLRLRPRRGEAERPAAVHDGDRRPRHPLHPRQVAPRERAADDRHARLAGLRDRDPRCRAPAHRSDGARRERGGRLPPGDPLDTGLRLLGQAGHDRLGSRPHRACLDGADEAPGVHAVRRPGRRLGRDHHRPDGRAGAAGAARDPHQHAGRRSARHLQGVGERRPRAGRSLSRRGPRLRAAAVHVHEGHRLRDRDVSAAADALRDRGLPRRPGRVDARPRRAEPGGHHAGIVDSSPSTT